MQQSAKRTSVWSDKVEASKFGVQSSGLKADRGYVGHKAAKMMKRSKTIEARQQQAIEQKSSLLKNVERAENLKLFPLRYHTDTLVTFSEVAPVYADKLACAPVSFTVQQGERIVLEGKNGSGKSSLLKLLVGELSEHVGTVKIGSGLLISYVPQDTSHLSGGLSDFVKMHCLDESLFKAILHKMDFMQIQFAKDMKEFSSGQKKKVLLAKSLCEQAHLYVWDEPLNYIDTYSRIQIENLIKTFLPTMIFVEHDRTFRDTIATKSVAL